MLITQSRYYNLNFGFVYSFNIYEWCAVMMNDQFVSCLYKGHQEWRLSIVENILIMLTPLPFLSSKQLKPPLGIFYSKYHKSILLKPPHPPSKQPQLFLINTGIQGGVAFFYSLLKALGTALVPLLLFALTFPVFFHYPILFLFFKF